MQPIQTPENGQLLPLGRGDARTVRRGHEGSGGPLVTISSKRIVIDHLPNDVGGVEEVVRRNRGGQLVWQQDMHAVAQKCKEIDEEEVFIQDQRDQPAGERGVGTHKLDAHECRRRD